MDKKRILLIDDDKDFLDILATHCRRMDMEVETAANSLTALAILGLRPPDVICMDVEMPTGNGLDICEFLQSDPTVASTPLICLTGRKDADTLRRCEALNAHYVHKSPHYRQQFSDVLDELTSEQARERVQQAEN